MPETPKDFEHARSLYAQQARSSADVVEPYGWEDADGFLVVDRRFAETFDAPALFVSKTTGLVEPAIFLDALPRIAAMTEVGDHPPED